MNSLISPSKENVHSAVSQAIFAVVVIYFMTAFIGIFFFGSEISESILINIGLEGDNWESDVLRVFFLIILICHVPFIFFFGKESVLIVIDEYRSKSIS